MTETNEINYDYKWYVMASVAMSIFLATIDGSIVNVALPTLVRELQSDFPTVQWVVLAYLLTITTLILSVGRLADIRGKKPLYNAGFVVFTLGSVLCGLAPTVYWLIGFRVLQGVGAALIMALGMAIVTESFPPTERGKAIGITGGIVSIGIIAGPTLGGLLIEWLSWHWIFFVNLPIGLLGTWMAWRYVPAVKPAGGQKFDYWGGLTLFISLFALLLALTLGQDRGFSDGLILLLFGAWFIFTLLFIVIELNTAQPMIHLSLFRNRLFSINLITGFMSFIAISGTFILLPFYLENVLGYDVAQVGLLLAVVPVALGVLSPISGTLSDRFGSRPIIVIGLILLLIGYYTISTLNAQTTAAGYILRLLPLGLGMGIFMSPNNSAIMGAASRQQLGIVSGLLSISRTLGQTVGIAVLGAIWAGRVFYHVGQTLPGGATTAPATAQVAALQDAFFGLIFMIALALALSIWGFVQERRDQQIPVVVEHKPVA
jgi:EmrB/QacA subfamily drug resistance transporter